jgi:hypothetical protein
MTPTDAVLIGLLTFLWVTIIDWLFAPQRRVVVVAVVLVLSFFWVVGLRVIVTR